MQYLHCVCVFFPSICLAVSLQITVPVKVSEYITTLIREAAFSTVSLITSRPNREPISDVCAERPRTGPRRPTSGPPSLDPASTLRACLTSRVSNITTLALLRPHFKYDSGAIYKPHIIYNADFQQGKKSLNIEFQFYIFGYHINTSAFGIC